MDNKDNNKADLSSLVKFIRFFFSPIGKVVAIIGVIILLSVPLLAITTIFMSDGPVSCSTQGSLPGGDDGSTQNNKEVAKQLFDHMTNQRGFSGAAGAGVVAIAKRESGLNPKAKNSGGGVAGLLQWSGWGSNVNGSRITAEGSIKAGDESTLTIENEFKLIDYELDHGYKSVQDKVQIQTDPFQAAKDWSKGYEGVSLDDPQSKLDQLEKDALSYYAEFNGESIPGNPGITGGNSGGSTGLENSDDDCSIFGDDGSGAEGYGLPVKGKYSLGTGTYPSYEPGGLGHDHNGVDFQSQGLSENDVNPGTDKAGVYASHNGSVEHVWHQGDQYMVIVKGTDNKYTYYGHAMVSPLVKEGDPVKRGQLISHEGYGGDVRPKNLGAAHVHFGISTDGINFGPNAGNILSPADFLPLPNEVLPDGKDGGPNDRVTGSAFTHIFDSKDTDKDE